MGQRRYSSTSCHPLHKVQVNAQPRALAALGVYPLNSTLGVCGQATQRHTCVPTDLLITVGPKTKDMGLKKTSPVEWLTHTQES
jgi:hypothetical protein